MGRRGENRVREDWAVEGKTGGASWRMDGKVCELQVDGRKGGLGG